MTSTEWFEKPKCESVGVLDEANHWRASISRAAPILWLHTEPANLQELHVLSVPVACLRVGG